MVGLGLLEPIGIIEGKIQARVAKFLSMKDALMRLARSTSLTVQSEAKELLDRQYALEKDLQTTLNTINVIKSGAYSITDIVTAGNFAYEMENHINAVHKLQDKTKGTVTPSILSTGIGSTPIILGALAIGAILVLRR